MTPWKVVLYVLLLLLPGGSLVLLVLATAKALRTGRDRLLVRPSPGSLSGPVPVAVANGGKS